MPVDVKICGLTRPEDAALAVSLGAWRLGVVFAGGPRVISVRQAQAIVHAAGSVPVIGVYQSQSVATILEMSAEAGLRGVQLHRPAAAGDVARLHGAGLEVWQVHALEPGGATARHLQGGPGTADVQLVEPAHPDRAGGVRSGLDLAAARRLRVEWLGARMALAGGLAPESVTRAIEVVGPDAVDVSSGVECAPGIKDPVKLARFMEQVRDALPPT